VFFPENPAHEFVAPQVRRGDAVVTSYDDAVVVLREVDFSKPPIPWMPFPQTRVLLRMFLALDPPDHTRLRRVVAPLFTPAAIADLRADLQAMAADVLDAAPTPFDVVRDFAYPFPFRVACRLVGAREDDWELISTATRTVTASLDEPMPLRLADIGPILRSLARGRLRPVAVLRAGGVLVRYARDRLADSDGPVVDVLRRAVRDGDISEDEAVSTWVLVFLAGHETSANLIANAVHALATHPEQLARVNADPALIPAAVDETLRWDPPVPLNARSASRDTAVGGVAVRAGNAALLSIIAVNRDPSRVEDGDSFVVGRTPAPPHLSFGFGTHFCLGAFLARAEAEIALEHLLRRAPDLRLSAPAIRRSTTTVSGFDTMPLEFDPQSRPAAR
jgi:hypothetical protein